MGGAFSEKEIQEDEYRDVFFSLLERSGVVVAILDPSLRVRSVNGALGARHPGEVRDRDFAEFLHPSVRQYTLRQFGRLVQGHRGRLVGRTVALCFEGGAVRGRLTAFRVADDEGQARMIVVQFTPEQAVAEHDAPPGCARLTPLSAKVLEGVAAGNATARLAARLFLSSQGIEYHVGMLLRQFDVPNRTALAAKAYSLGMFGIGSWPPRVLPDYVRAEDQGDQEDDAARAEARVAARRA
ncbi:helix-turn-helix transcriptional regulator [Streptomyces sp. NPDC050560]|uniref:helix-turn-helix transcriptional regulator n=1 Tax=Streptomyces sp. NPDC050560 TaxID=3365630 RepID=UPI0037AA66F7